MARHRQGIQHATLRDVARLAGVHPATASRALDPARRHLVSEATGERIQKIATEIGYRANSFARSLRTNSSGMVGVVVADVANPFLPPLLRGIEQVLRAEGRLVLIAETHDDSATLQEILDHFASRRVDAVIVSAGHAGDEGAILTLAAAVPAVMAVRVLARGAGVPTVTHDDDLGGRLAARHLVELGHRRLVQLRGPLDVSSFRGRAEGFAAVMAATAARELPSDVATTPTAAEGERLASLALDSPHGVPTAFFAHNDLMAVGALQAFRARGLSCPGDVSIVGYNDAPLSNHLSPPLTTVSLPSLEVGRRAATLALDAIAGRRAAVIERLPPELVVRGSTARPTSD